MTAAGSRSAPPGSSLSSMTSVPEDAGQPAGTGGFRASDSDRERVAEVLREAAGEGRLNLDELDERVAAAYAAKTYSELEPLTRDLPAPGATPGATPGGAAVPAGPVPGRASHFAVSIMGGFHRRGDWLVPRTFTAFSLMGGGTIDLREARFAEGQVTIVAFAVMGGIDVIVPEDARVDVRGIGIMGGVGHGARGPGEPGGAMITVRGLALMGGIGVRRKRRKGQPHQQPDGSRGSEPPRAISDSG